MQDDVYQAFQTLNKKVNKIQDLLVALAVNLTLIIGKEVDMLEALRAEVERNTSVDESAKALLAGLTAKIEELIAHSGDTVDPVELQGIVDALKGSTDGLAAAVTSNTPAAPTT